MKVALYILIATLMFGCSSNKEVFKQLRDNTISYSKLKMTKTALTKSAVVYVTYNKKSNNFNIALNSRDTEAEITIEKCLINKKDAVIEASNNSSLEWQDSYLVYTSEIAKKHATLSCTLNSSDKFSVTF